VTTSALRPKRPAISPAPSDLTRFRQAALPEEDFNGKIEVEVHGWQQGYFTSEEPDSFFG